MSETAGYRRLGGKNGSMASRNASVFGALIALVVVFTLFYCYNSAANEAAALQREVETQTEHIAKLKNELLEGNVNLEKARTSESVCVEAKKSVDTKHEECSTELDKLKAKVADLQSSLSEKDETIKSLKNEIESTKVKSEAMQQAGVGQEAVLIKLNETVELMKKDLALKDDVIHDLKSKLEAAGAVGANNEKRDALADVTTTKKAVETADEKNVLAEPRKPGAMEHLSLKDTETGVVLPDPKVPEKPVEEEEQEQKAANVPEPQIGIESNGADEKEVEAQKQKGNFVGIREPGMRVKMEEARAAEEAAAEQGNQNAPLIDAAQKDDEE